MTTSLSALQGKFGTHTYFVVTMPAAEVIQKLTLPKDLEEWDKLKFEERWQRDLNYNRVKKHIAPYLANDPDRFFGALIVDIHNPEEVEFETLADAMSGAKVGKHLERVIKELGVLHLSGKELLVPLDGQHRLAALQFAITGKDERQQELVGIDASTEIAADQVTLILLLHDTLKSRKVFNKVNRYAKPTTKNDNLITADDDVIAVIARRIGESCFDSRLVNYQSNTLNKKSPCFTTLPAIAEIVEAIALSTLGEKVDRSLLPEKPKIKLLQQEADLNWRAALAETEVFSRMLADESEAGDQRRRDIRAEDLLGKPIAQVVAFEVALFLQAEANIKMKASYKALNDIDWSMNNPIWQGVLMEGNKVRSGRTARAFAVRFVLYLLGHCDDEVALRKRYQENHSQGKKAQLPPPLKK